MFELVALGEGLHTLRDLESGETFHPVVGPMVEANAIHIAPLELENRMNQSLTIWDVGLGAAANAIALLDQASSLREGVHCELISFDRTLEPLHFALENADRLGYPSPWKNSLLTLAREGRVGLEMKNGGKFDWRLCLEDFTHLPKQPAPDAIFYDPYSPAKNPAMWSLEHFSRLQTRLTKPAILTSYSRSTAVRVTLLLAGFFVGVGHATGKKEQTTLAATNIELLKFPLPSNWLNRVRRSTQARPLGSGEPGPISAEDLERLENHPQFIG